MERKIKFVTSDVNFQKKRFDEIKISDFAECVHIEIDGRNKIKESLDSVKKKLEGAVAVIVCTEVTFLDIELGKIANRMNIYTCAFSTTSFYDSLSQLAKVFDTVSFFDAVSNRVTNENMLEEHIAYLVKTLSKADLTKKLHFEYREDVTDYLIARGMNREESIAITQDVRKGKFKRLYFKDKEKYDKILSKQEIFSFCKIDYLPKKERKNEYGQKN